MEAQVITDPEPWGWGEGTASCMGVPATPRLHQLPFPKKPKDQELDLSRWVSSGALLAVWPWASLNLSVSQ